MAMGSSTHGFLGLMLLVISMFMLSSSLQATAYKFYVGGKQGWVPKPKESYNTWAERTRFQVNDTLYFKYNVRHDSVLVVDKESYFSCKTKNPIHKLNKEFKFNRSGPFYFISGRGNHCKFGQKLIVVVLSLNHRRHAPSHAPGHAPSHSPAKPPAHTPAHSPSHAPAHAPSHAPAHSHSWSPVYAPAPGPSSAASSRFGGSVSVAMGLGIWVVLVLYSFI